MQFINTVNALPCTRDGQYVVKFRINKSEESIELAEKVLGNPNSKILNEIIGRVFNGINAKYQSRGVQIIPFYKEEPLEYDNLCYERGDAIIEMTEKLAKHNTGNNIYLFSCKEPRKYVTKDIEFMNIGIDVGEFRKFEKLLEDSINEALHMNEEGMMGDICEYIQRQSEYEKGDGTTFVKNLKKVDANWQPKITKPKFFEGVNAGFIYGSNEGKNNDQMLYSNYEKGNKI